MNTISIDAVERVRFPRNSADNFEIKVPASIANLGPGFDTLAVAVQLYLRLRVKKLPGRGELHFHFVDHKLHGENCIERAYRSLAGADFDRLALLVCRSPQRNSHASGAGKQRGRNRRRPSAIRSGSGTSARRDAAECGVCAGVSSGQCSGIVAGRPHDQLPTGRWRRACHQRRVAGFAGFHRADAGAAVGDAASLERVLPQCVSRADAVFNLQRVALLLNSLQSGDYSLLRHAHGRPRTSAGAATNRAGASPGAGVTASRPAWSLPQRLGPIDRGDGRAQSSRDRRACWDRYTSAPAWATRFAPCKHITESTNESRCSVQGCCVARAQLPSRWASYQGTTSSLCRKRQTSRTEGLSPGNRSPDRQGLEPCISVKVESCGTSKDVP